MQDGVRVRRPRATRIDVELPVTLNGAPGTTANLSAEGALVRTTLQVELDDQLDVELGLERPLRLHARVVRHGDGMIALRFLGGAPSALAEFIAAA